MRKLLAVFAVVMLVSCAKSREYPDIIYDYISDDITACTLYTSGAAAEANFIADTEGNIYIEIFALDIPGPLYTKCDNSTGVQVATNSRGTMVFYDGKLYVQGKAVEGKTMLFDSRVMVELRFVEDVFGAEFEFREQDGKLYPSVSFHHEVYESQKIDGGEVVSVSGAPDVGDVQQLSSDDSMEVYSGIVAGGFRVDAINWLLTNLVREGFEMIERPSDTMVLLWRGDSYVAIKSWGINDIRASYINCMMEDEQNSE